MKANSRSLVLLVLCMLSCAADACAQAARYQVYFVAVGSGWYATPTEQDLHGFDRIHGANRSADIVANTLSVGDAVYGVELKADDQSFVTVSDVEKAIHTVASRITATKPSNP